MCKEVHYTIHFTFVNGCSFHYKGFGFFCFCFLGVYLLTNLSVGLAHYVKMYMLCSVPACQLQTVVSFHLGFMNQTHFTKLS